VIFSTGIIGPPSGGLFFFWVADTQDYRAALAGYEAARVVGEYRDGTPGIDTWDKEQDQRLKTIIDQYHTGRPISPAGDDTGGTFFNPARLDPAPREP